MHAQHLVLPCQGFVTCIPGGPKCTHTSRACCVNGQATVGGQWWVPERGRAGGRKGAGRAHTSRGKARGGSMAGCACCRANTVIRVRHQVLKVALALSFRLCTLANTLTCCRGITWADAQADGQCSQCWNSFVPLWAGRGPVFWISSTEWQAGALWHLACCILSK